MLALAAAEERPVKLRELDRRREIDRSWFQRAADGRLRLLRRPVRRHARRRPGPARLPGRAGRHLPAPDAAAAARGRARTTAATRSWTTARSTRGWARWPTSRTLAGALHERGMSLCVDLVLNHTAARARLGAGLAGRRPGVPRTSTWPSPTGRMPDAYERTICRRCSPTARRAASPGSRRRRPAGSGRRSGPTSGTWTTPTPTSSRRCSERSCWLANRGVDVLRLDAVPFMWKRLGTDLPEPARGAPASCRRCARWPGWPRPGVVFKAEAIVAPDDLVPYLGGARPVPARVRAGVPQPAHGDAVEQPGHPRRPAGGARRCAGCGRSPPTRRWVTYVRGHDDIGWAVSDADAAAVGLGLASSHRRFLNDFFAGRFPGSFARGALFQENPATGDARISGIGGVAVRHRGGSTTGDDAALDRRHPPAGAAVRGRLLASAASRCSTWATSSALRNDTGYLADPGAGRRQPLDAPAADGLGGRRPPARPGDAGGPRVRLDAAAGGAARRTCSPCARGGEREILDVGNDAVLALAPPAPAQRHVRRPGQLRRDAAVGRRRHVRPASAGWRPC